MNKNHPIAKWIIVDPNDTAHQKIFRPLIFNIDKQISIKISDIIHAKLIYTVIQEQHIITSPVIKIRDQISDNLRTLIKNNSGAN